jgi:hypothetical protein
LISLLATLDAQGLDELSVLALLLPVLVFMHLMKTVSRSSPASFGLHTAYEDRFPLFSCQFWSSSSLAYEDRFSLYSCQFWSSSSL